MTEDEKKVAKSIYEALKTVFDGAPCPVHSPCFLCSNEGLCSAGAKLFHYVENKLREGA